MALNRDSEIAGSDTAARVLRLRMYDGDREVPYRVCRSARARSIRISIDRDYAITLTLPRGASEREGVDFLESKAAWLRRHLSRQRPRTGLLEFLRRDPAVSLEGQRVPLEVLGNASRTALRFSRGGAKIVVEAVSSDLGEAEMVELLRGLAARALAWRTETLAEQHGFAVRRISVRDQSSRWGSCSSGGTVSLNWRLLLVPPEVQDYVIRHELAHLRHMNHSPRFWSELCRLDPLARERDRWLTEAGEAVMALGRKVKSSAS